MSVTEQQQKILATIQKLGVARVSDINKAYERDHGNIGNLREQLSRLTGTLMIEKNECNEYKLTPRATAVLKGEAISAVNTRFTQKQFKEIEDYAKDPELFDTLADDFHPGLVGIKDAKIATILAMISQSDSLGDKQRMSVLLVGEPGTGKSQIIEYAKDQFWGVMTDGKASSAGLRGTAGTGTDHKSGVLELADESVLYIDELDKMEDEDQEALLQALQSGRYINTQARDYRTVNARIRCVATANTLVPLIQPLKDRFDLIIRLPKISQEEKESLIGNKILQWGKQKKREEDIVLLKNYLSYASQFETALPTDRTQFITTIQNEIKSGCLKTFDTRKLEGVIRLTLSIAKLRLHHPATKEDLTKAIDLIRNQTI